MRRQSTSIVTPTSCSPIEVKCRRLAGFTLIEMMVAMMVAVILLTVGIPSFNDLAKNNRLVTQSNAIAAVMNGARAEAIAQRRTVTVCGSSNGTSCSGAWGAGWLTFQDADADGTVDVGDPLLVYVNSAANSAVNVGFVGATTVRYNALGFALAGSNGTMRLCDERGDTHARALLISSTGRLSVASDTDSPADKIVDDAAGVNIDCP
jgi:type IV fimbrial biogenesis protein FimT